MGNAIFLVVNAGDLIGEYKRSQHLKDIVGNMDMLRGV